MKGEALKAALIEQGRQRRERHEIGGMLGGEERMVFYALPFSAADMAKYGQRLFDGDESAFVDMLIDKAQTEDGERMFDDSAREWLPSLVAPTVLAEISAALAGGSLKRIVEEAAGLEDAKGNSEGTRSSGHASMPASPSDDGRPSLTGSH